jgi:hypothetical protein
MDFEPPVVGPGDIASLSRHLFYHLAWVFIAANRAERRGPADAELQGDVLSALFSASGLRIRHEGKHISVMHLWQSYSWLVELQYLHRSGFRDTLHLRYLQTLQRESSLPIRFFFKDLAIDLSLENLIDLRRC